jgi:hypothetical protein
MLYNFSSKIFSARTKTSAVVPPVVPLNYISFGTEWADNYPKGKSYQTTVPPVAMEAAILGGESTPNSRNISSVLRIPETDIILVAGCRYDGSDAIPGNGGVILRSDDLGTTWVSTAQEMKYGLQVRGLFYDETSGNVYCVSDLAGFANQCNLLVSADSGSTWTEVSHFDPGYADDDSAGAIYRHTNGDYYMGVFPSYMFFSAADENAKIFKSTDGLTWIEDYEFNVPGKVPTPTTKSYYGVNRIKLINTDLLAAFGYTRTNEIGAWVHTKNLSTGIWDSPLQLEGSEATWGIVYDIISDNSYYYISGSLDDIGRIWQYSKETMTYVSHIDTGDSPMQLELSELSGEPVLVFCGQKIIGTISFNETGELSSLDYNPADLGINDISNQWERPWVENVIVNGFVNLDD